MWKRISGGILVALAVLGFIGCKEATLGPELFGSLEGQVLDNSSGSPLSGVGITTSPPSNAVVTDQNGEFLLDEISEGNYTITASHEGYETNSVTVSVRENRTTSATIFLKQLDEESNDASMVVEIINWDSRSISDSMFADVQYRVDNTGSTLIPAYEVYFRINTDDDSYLEEQHGDSLAPGQADIRNFSRYLRQDQPTEILIDSFWFQGQDP